MLFNIKKMVLLLCLFTASCSFPDFFPSTLYFDQSIINKNFLFSLTGEIGTLQTLQSKTNRFSLNSLQSKYFKNSQWFCWYVQFLIGSNVSKQNISRMFVVWIWVTLKYMAFLFVILEFLNEINLKLTLSTNYDLNWFLATICTE